MTASRGEPEPATCAIELTNVAKTFPAPAGVVHALRDVSLSARSGDYVSLSGTSGSGKTTLLNILGLLSRPSSGEYRLSGLSTRTLGPRDLDRLRGAGIGFVFQGFHLLTGRTVLENVMLAGLYGGVDEGTRRVRALEVIDLLQLSHRTHFDQSRLSGGEKQRVAIARAIANRPTLLIADEPTGNLDATNTDVVLESFDRIHALGQTIVVASHDTKVADRAATHFVLDNGRLTQG